MYPLQKCETRQESTILATAKVRMVPGTFLYSSPRGEGMRLVSGSWVVRLLRAPTGEGVLLSGTHESLDPFWDRFDISIPTGGLRARGGERYLCLAPPMRKTWGPPRGRPPKAPRLLAKDQFVSVRLPFEVAYSRGFRLSPPPDEGFTFAFLISMLPAMPRPSWAVSL